MSFFCRMKAGAGGIVYASAWVLADMDMDTAELGWDGWDGVEWVGWEISFVTGWKRTDGCFSLYHPKQYWQVRYY